MNTAQLLALAARATQMASDAHRRGDFLACARLQATAQRYRDVAFGRVAS